MCITRSNVFLQSMKTNPLSVKKLMKKLILRALRQLYAASEISILIRWVMPPTKVENLQLEFFFSLEIPQLISSTLQCIHSLCRFSSLDTYEFMFSTTFIYSYLYKLIFLLSECDRTLPPLCYTQPNLFTNSSCAFYLKPVQNLHCVLVS